MRVALGILLASLFPATAAADTVVLKGGKKISGVVVSQNDEQFVVINPWNSRLAAMTFEIPDKNRIPRDKVEQVILEEDARIEFRRRAAARVISPTERVALAEFALQQRMKEEAEEQLLLALTEDPALQEALERYGRVKWEAHLSRNRQLTPEVRAQEQAYLAIRDVDEAQRALFELERAGSKRGMTYLERARRSAALAKGRRDKVPLTLNSHEAPGATYAIYVPESYDPLQPTGLVVALHGGGAGGKDETLVTGSGEAALPFYVDAAREWGLLVVCPTALVAPWNKPGNRPVLEHVLAEMKLLYNVDPRRIYLTGHSMGGFGTWYWSVQLEDTWAAVAPCAGGGGMAAVPRLQKAGLPVYIYHGSDDAIVRPDADRQCARLLLGDDKKKTATDFVYTELDGVGHGFPDAVRNDIFRWFAGRWRDGKRLARSSFEAKVTPEEIKAFGDPSQFDGGGDASLKELIAQLQRGGGAAAQAAEQLGARKDKASVKAVADVLRSRKSSADVRTQAARALGVIATPECIAPLAGCANDEDFRVVDAATAALGAIGDAAARPGLLAMARAFGGWFRASFEGGAITHTEYQVRLGSFGVLLRAIASTGDAATFHDVMRVEIVDAVFPAGERYRVLGDDDERFRNVSPTARKDLVRALGECLQKLADPRGAELLRPIAQRFAHENGLVSEVERALAALAD